MRRTAFDEKTPQVSWTTSRCTSRFSPVLQESGNSSSRSLFFLFLAPFERACVVPLARDFFCIFILERRPCWARITKKPALLLLSKWPLGQSLSLLSGCVRGGGWLARKTARIGKQNKRKILKLKKRWFTARLSRQLLVSVRQKKVGGVKSVPE